MSKLAYPAKEKDIKKNNSSQKEKKDKNTQKKKWVIFPFLWKSLVRFCTALGAMMLITISISTYSAYNLLAQSSYQEPQSNNFVLFVEFGNAPQETSDNTNVLESLSSTSSLTMRNMVRAIDMASKDDRVKGMLGRFQPGVMSLAQVQELRQAILRFKQSGKKFTYAYSSSYGEGGGGLSLYYLASAFDERWMQPLGVVSIPGINAQIPFLKDSLDTLGVGTQFYQRKEYKTAYESLTHSEISQENSLMMNALVKDIRSTLIPEISKDIGMDQEAFVKLVHKGLFTAPDAEQVGLITKSDYADRLIDKINEQVTGDPEGEDIRYIDAKRYIQIVDTQSSSSGVFAGWKQWESIKEKTSPPSSQKSSANPSKVKAGAQKSNETRAQASSEASSEGLSVLSKDVSITASSEDFSEDQSSFVADANTQTSKEQFLEQTPSKVALIYVVGAIMPDDVHSSVMIGGPVASAETIAPAILEAKDDEDIKAIVIRVDSPGGSPSASESILRAVEQAKEEGKLVIVSMGSAAASGGYWVSAYADQIFALPHTLTGSIGVVGGKIYLKELWKKLGINWEEVTWGDNATIWSVNQPFSQTEQERISIMLDHVYDSFVERVSKGRDMDIESVEKLAKGRVWTGQQAQENGLVDQLGGLASALEYTAKELGLSSANDLDIIIMPKPKTPMEKVIDLLSQQVKIQDSLSVFSQKMSYLLTQFEPLSLYFIEQPTAVYEPMDLRIQ